jgi:general secretion pathway protein F
MPVFAYRAFGADGAACGGVIGADSLRTARQALRSRGVYPTELREQAVPRWERRPPPAALAAATRQLATLAGAGVPLAEALGVVAAQADHPALVRALTGAHGALLEGRPLADALAASPVVFPPLFSELVRAGEASGALPAVLLRLAEHTEATAAARARLRATLAYPAVMALATVAVLGFLLAWVVPEVARLFADAGARLPLATRALLLVTRVTSAVWWLVALALAAAAWGLRAWAATPAGRAHVDRLVLRLPVAGPLVRRAAVARIARTLASLLAGGVPLAPALGIARATAGNRHLADAVTAVGGAVERGEPLALALEASGEFPPLLVRLAAVGERGGSLPAMLERAAVTYEGEAAAAAAGLAALVEPALVLVMGGVVLALVLAILLPLFELNTLVR